jgi:hypothetical protein
MSLPTFHRLAGRQVVPVRLRVVSQLVSVSDIRGQIRATSLFGRAPMVHDLNLALAMWGFLSDSPPSDLVSVRKELFHGVGNAVHHYKEGRDIADMIPESTLRMSPEDVISQFATQWRVLTGFAQ